MEQKYQWLKRLRSHEFVSCSSKSYSNYSVHFIPLQKEKKTSRTRVMYYKTLVQSVMNNVPAFRWRPHCSLQYHKYHKSLIIRVINKIGRPRSRSPICLTTNWTTQSFVKVLWCIRLFFTIKTQQIPRFCFTSSEKKIHIYASAWWRVLSNYLGTTHTALRNCLIKPIRFENFVIVMIILWITGFHCRTIKNEKGKHSLG